MSKLLIWFLNCFAFFLFFLPLSWQMKLGDVLGYVCFYLLRWRRKVISNNLNKVFPHWSRQKKNRVGRACICHFGRSFIELMKMLRCNPVSCSNQFNYYGLEHLKKHKAKVVECWL